MHRVKGSAGVAPEERAHPAPPAGLSVNRDATREVAMGTKKPVSQIERILEDNASLPHLQALVDAGCNRNEVVIAMELAFLADESWETLMGMDLRSIKRAHAQIRDCADFIDRLNRSELIYRLSIEHRDPGFVGLHESPTLSERLREYVSLLDDRLRLFGPKRKIRTHVWKAWIVAHVVEDTKKPHDSE